MVAPAACSRHISAREYMHARALDRGLQRVAHSASRDDTGNSYKRRFEKVECRKAGRMAKEEVESALYSPDKVHGRFSGSPRSVQEKEHPGIAV